MNSEEIETLAGEARVVHESDRRFNPPVQLLTDKWEASLVITKDTSDGYHTFGELYEHRMALTLALATELLQWSWRSKAHHPTDGPMFDGSFIVGIQLAPHRVITYHYNLEYWGLFDGLETLEHAP